MRLDLPSRSCAVTASWFLAILLAACQAPAAAPATGDAPGDVPIEVVATTTVFADMVENVGGNLVHVTSLVPRNGDVHTFSPRPADIAAVARAKLLVMNGLGLDDWLEKTMANASATRTPLVKLGVDLPGVALLPGEEPGSRNPHLWLDVRYAELYVDRIADGLAQEDPPDGNTFHEQAAAYNQTLDALDGWVRQQVATIPPDDRRIVTFHDAFPYFSRAYGITIVGVAVEAPGQDPSAAYTAHLIDAIRAAGVKAIFSEKQFPTKVIDQIAAQTGATVVSTLYDDTLGDPPVSSYEAVMRWDVEQLVTALGGHAP